MSEYTCNVKRIFQQFLTKYFTVLNLVLNSPAPFHHMTGNLVKDYFLYWKVESVLKNVTLGVPHMTGSLEQDNFCIGKCSQYGYPKSPAYRPTSPCGHP